jgi:quercetin dioxygenase-like cupin family protein
LCIFEDTPLLRPRESATFVRRRLKIMKIIRLADVVRTPVTMEGAKGAIKQLPIGQADGSPGFSVRVFTIEPGGHTPYHTHPFEHVNYIIEGRGAVVTGDGTERAVARGDFVLVLPGEKHQYRNASEEPFVMICAVPKEYE